MHVSESWQLVVGLAVVVCLSSMIGLRADEQAGQEPIRINKIYWCIHPYCWSTHGRG